MTMSEPRARCTAMDSSGPRKTGLPSMGDLNLTPASVMRRMAPRLKTWKPPESVRIGRDQCMKRCSPPRCPMVSVPGRSIR